MNMGPSEERAPDNELYKEAVTAPFNFFNWRSVKLERGVDHSTLQGHVVPEVNTLLYGLPNAKSVDQTYVHSFIYFFFSFLYYLCLKILYKVRVSFEWD